MKKIVFTLFGLLACLEICAQLGYRFEGKFIRLKPNISEPYYVLTKNTESKEYLKNIGNTEVYMISENSFFCLFQTQLIGK